jgi:hypothetical protein
LPYEGPEFVAPLQQERCRLESHAACSFCAV